METAALSEDYEDFLFEMMERACAVGMLPSQFWEEEPSDTLVFIEQAQRQKQRDVYNGALLTASMFGVTLSNSFRAKGSPSTSYPSIEDVFEIDEPNKPTITPLEKRANELRAQFAGTRGIDNGSNR